MGEVPLSTSIEQEGRWKVARDLDRTGTQRDGGRSLSLFARSDLVGRGCFSERWGSIREQRLRSNVKQFQGGLVFKAHRLLYHSTLGRE